MRDLERPQERAVLSACAREHGELGNHAANGRAVLQDAVLRNKEANGVATEYGLCSQSQAGKTADEINGLENAVPRAKHQ